MADAVGSLERMRELYKRSVMAEIRQLKESREITVPTIAKFCGVSVDAVNGWLYKEYTPTLGNIKKLDDLFDVSRYPRPVSERRKDG